MSTIILENKNHEIFLIPDWTMEHAGFVKNQEGNNVGHTDIKNSTGSIFNSSMALKPLDLFNTIINDPQVENMGNVYQTQYSESVGWSALDTNTTKTITGVVLKQEAPLGSKIASTVLAPAYENKDFGSATTQTNILSAIAPKTEKIDFLPEDVKDNQTVLQAMKEGKLRTFVSIFPGPILVNHQSLPKTSEFDKNITFEVHPENSMYIKINMTADNIYEFIKTYNEESLLANQEVNIIEDKKNIIQKINQLSLHEKREHFLNSFHSGKKNNLTIK